MHMGYSSQLSGYLLLHHQITVIGQHKTTFNLLHNQVLTPRDLLLLYNN